VFYTWVVRFMAETISLFTSIEGIAYLATGVPHDGVVYDHSKPDGRAINYTDPETQQIVPGEQPLPPACPWPQIATQIA
jgi:hypothetical protein